MDNNNQLTVQDIALVVNLIDTCSQRGAFRGEELVAVGTLRQKFADAVKANASQSDDAKQETDGDAE